MRKFGKGYTIALIFTLGLAGVFLFQGLAYSLTFSEKTLRVPSFFQQDKDTTEEVVRFIRPSRERNPGFKLGMGSNKYHMARIVEELIHEKIVVAQNNGEIAVIRMPTGNTPLKDKNGLPGVYDLLAERDDIDWSRVVIFMLDEYGGTSFDYHLYIYENFIKRLKGFNKKLPKVYCLVDPESAWPIDKIEAYRKKIEEFSKKGVLSISPDEYSSVFDREIKKARPDNPHKAHVSFGGLGKARETKDGKFKGVHIAFNEEGSLPDERTRRIELSPRTIYSNCDDLGIQSQIGLSAHEIEELGIEGIKKALEEGRIPKAYANTIGMYELLEETDTIIFAADGKSKIPSVDVVVFDEVSPDNPAAYIRKHNDSYLVIARDAVSERLDDLFNEDDTLPRIEETMERLASGHEIEIEEFRKASLAGNITIVNVRVGNQSYEISAIGVKKLNLDLTTEVVRDPQRCIEIATIVNEVDGRLGEAAKEEDWDWWIPQLDQKLVSTPEQDKIEIVTGYEAIRAKAKELMNSGEGIFATDSKREGPVETCYIDWGGTLSTLTEKERKEVLNLFNSTGIDVHILTTGGSPYEIRKQLESEDNLSYIKSVIAVESKAGYLSNINPRDKLLLFDDSGANFYVNPNVIRVGVIGKSLRGLFKTEEAAGEYEYHELAEYYIATLGDIPSLKRLIKDVLVALTDNTRAELPTVAELLLGAFGEETNQCL